MGVEKGQYIALTAFAHDQPIGAFAGPGASTTGNKRWMSLVLSWITGRTPDARKRLLAAIEEQLRKPTAKRRGGLGVVEGMVEGFCLDHHGDYYLLGTLAIIKHALAVRDEAMLDAALRLLAAWLGLFGDHDAPDGQVACAGWRAWPFRPEGGVENYLRRIVAPDGWHHVAPGGTLSVSADTCNRAWRELPQLDNRLRERNAAWMAKNRADSGSWQPAILMQRLMDRERLRERIGALGDLSYHYPIGLVRYELAGLGGATNGIEVRMAADPGTVAPKGWAPAPAVRMLFDAKHRNRVSWHPRTLPPELG
jgi:hypothetical protein